MYADLFVHETVKDRAAFNRIWDRIPGTLSLAEMEREFIRQAVDAGLDAEEAEGFLLGDPSE